jgi:glycosyltransferase involved in cell wall biosynthesis
MKVIFLIQGNLMPSSRVRVLNLLPDLRGAGIDAAAVEYPQNLRCKWQVFDECRKHDVVVVQKKLPTRLDAALLRQCSRHLIYDVDDAVYLRQFAKSDCFEHPTSRRRFNRLVPIVDLVVAGNRILADAAKPLNPRVEVVASAVEVRKVPVRQHATQSGPYRIGWIGGEVNLEYAAMLGPVLRKLSDKWPIEYRLICNRPIALDGVRVCFRPWSLKDQERELSECDIGVMPLPNTPHAAGKCAYKALQYMAAGIPPVVSDVGVNSDVVGASGLVAACIDDFLPQLSMLICDSEARSRLGASARLRAEARYSVQSAVARWLEILQSLY